MKTNLLLLWSIVLSTCAVSGQVNSSFPYNGIRPKADIAVAFTHANIYTDYKTVIEDATLIIKNGKVEQCGKGIEVPKDAVVRDMHGN